MLEAILLLARPAPDPADVLTLDELAQYTLDIVERRQRREPLGAGLELARRLRAPEQEHREHGKFFAVEAERFLREVTVFHCAASVPARQPREPVQAQPLSRVPDRRLVVGRHRVTVRRLIARQPQPVERQRILVRSRPALLDQAPQHTLLGRRKLGDVHWGEHNDAC